MEILIPENELETSHKSLRFATLNDIPWIISEAKKQFLDAPYFAFGVDDRKVRQLFEKLIVEGQEHSIILISHDGGKPVGALAAYAFEPMFSHNKIAIECLWFLLDDYRKGSRGRDMANAYEYWAKLVGCSHVQYGLLSSSPQRMASLYEKIGAAETERIFMKAL